MDDKILKVGVDAGSTTIKMVVVDGESNVIYKSYERHKADIQGTFSREIARLGDAVGDAALSITFTGSAGMGLAERVGAPFVQEVVASVNLVQRQFPGIATLFDVGGEDAKMVFFNDAGHPEIRMNGSCAGGTGAFIDQMASLMNITVEQLGQAAARHENLYPIASRCGVFAKTDIQNLISRNVPQADIAASTLHAVALQCITTLARGCDIKPPVLCVGGPLTFIPALREAFAVSVGLAPGDMLLPENSEYFPAWGAAFNEDNTCRGMSAADVMRSMEKTVDTCQEETLPRLFESEQQYTRWRDDRTIKPLVMRTVTPGESIDCYLGIDSGSTTTKIVVTDESSRIVYKFYSANEGNALRKVTEGMTAFYAFAAANRLSVNFLSTAVTGYGEDLVRSALGLDHGIVETMAHLCGAQYVNPDVSFILDIGGQDIKSMFIDNGVISNIELNEACSAGCGSFLQNFASTMGMSLDDFSRRACLSADPSDLGSRCTVFMNSKVKQALRENARVDDIAAGLAYSVVKNCLFKVLKISNLNRLGDHIVVQGGTFRNDAVYRCLELLSGKSVSSTDHPELMGAFGAALYAKSRREAAPADTTFRGEAALSMVDRLATRELHCKGCTNNCAILRFDFENGNVCYAGNKCEKIFFNSHKTARSGFNAFEKKNEVLFDLPGVQVAGVADTESSPVRAGSLSAEAEKRKNVKAALRSGVKPVLSAAGDGSARVCETSAQAVRDAAAAAVQAPGNGSVEASAATRGEGNPAVNPTPCSSTFSATAMTTISGAETGAHNTNPENNAEPQNVPDFTKTSPNPPVSAVGKRVGIPRVLNMFENYPFWHTLFTGCGFGVVLSPQSNFKLYQKGLGSVMSDNICFPAKLVHGHVLSLVESGVDRLFYPLVPKEEKEFGTSTDSWNCPVVSGYPDVVRSSIDPEGRHGIPFDTPVIGFNTDKALHDTSWNYIKGLGVARKVFDQAYRKACAVKEDKRRELVDFQKTLLDEAVKSGRPVFVITGRPYHADPLVHQKTGQILADLGVTVLTDDVFRDHDAGDFNRLNIVTQWSYPNRVVQSAVAVAKLPTNVQLIQMNSFGCGPDSFFMDEASSILKNSGKNLTVVRVDEIASPGSVRLRLRSLVESLRNKTTAVPSDEQYEGYSVPFTKQDKRRTILIPWLADFVSPFVPAFGQLAGYRMVTLPRPDRRSAEVGLKYGHNEVCYPSTLVLGDIIKALQSGCYDTRKTAIAITQTGGQCRATNYIAQIKTGLERAGFRNIPIVVLSTGGTFQNEQRGFKIPWLRLADIVSYGILYGDALQQMHSATAVRELEKGRSRELFDRYMDLGVEAVRRDDHRLLLKYLGQAVRDFNRVEVSDRHFEKIGLVGEIYVKYNDFAQAHIGDWLRKKGMEVVTPPIFDFVMQYFVNSKVNAGNMTQGMSTAEKMMMPILWRYLNRRIKAIEAVMKDFRYYHPSESIYVKAEDASQVLSLSNQFGEGWMIAAEVAHFSRRGVDKVVCIQPFGCIANHIVAKGIEKRVKTIYPNTNLLYLDIDSGIAEVNLQNRLHFMVAPGGSGHTGFTGKSPVAPATPDLLASPR